MKVTSSRSAVNTVKLLVYGRPGVGKTTLCASAPSPLIISCEGGLMALADKDIPVIEVDTVEEIYDALEFCSSKKGKKYKTICLDSASDIAEVFLSELKKDTKDPRQAYGKMNDHLLDLLRSFRDLKNKNVVIICKEKMVVDEGIELVTPSMPGKSLVEAVPYLFDIVAHMEIIENFDDDDDESFRALRCQPTDDVVAKDRSGKLNELEEPNLKKLFRKILS